MKFMTVLCFEKIKTFVQRNNRQKNILCLFSTITQTIDF